MSLTEIHAEIPKLSFAERQQLVRRAMAVEEETDITAEENAILDQRLADFRRDPYSGISAEGLKEGGLAADRRSMIQQIIVRLLAVEKSGSIPRAKSSAIR